MTSLNLEFKIIYSRYYNIDDIAKVGTTLVDIEVADIDTGVYFFPYKQFHNSRWCTKLHLAELEQI